MTLISRKLTIKGKKEVKFVGAHLPLPLNTYLTMYALVMETSKSAIICNEIDDWMTTQKSVVSETVLVSMLIEKVQDIYASSKGKGDKGLSQFKTAITKELSKKGIDADTIDILLKGVTNG